MKRLSVAWVAFLCLCQLNDAFTIKRAAKGRPAGVVHKPAPHAPLHRKLNKRSADFDAMQQMYRDAGEFGHLAQDNYDYNLGDGAAEGYWREFLAGESPMFEDTGYYPDYGQENEQPYDRQGIEDALRDVIQQELDRQKEKDDANDDIVSLGDDEIEQIFSPVEDDSDKSEKSDDETEEDTDVDKKNVDWLPKAAGFDVQGAKRNDDDDDESDEDEGQEIVKADGEVVPLSSKDVENLLSEPSEVNVHGVQHSVHVENINGKQEAEEKTTYDVTTKDDNNEHVLEVDQVLPEDQEDASEVSQEMQDAENGLLQDTNILHDILFRQMYSKKKKRSARPEELPTGYDGTEQEELAKRCLLQYIALEDAENEELAGALNWATMDQVRSRGQQDASMKNEVDHIKSAIAIELKIQQLQDECADILRASTNGELSDLLPTADEDADVEPSDELLKKRSEYVQQDNIIPDEDTDEATEVPAEIVRKVAEYILEASQGNGRPEEEGEKDEEPEEGPPGDPEQQGDWYMNPFYRDILFRAYGGNPEESAPRPQEECPALSHLIDGCSTLTSSGISMDYEALELCSRHQLCYVCGSAYDIPEENCDVLYFEQAHAMCNPGEGNCRDTSRYLFNLMQDTHRYHLHSPAMCDAPCVLAALTDTDMES